MKPAGFPLRFEESLEPGTDGYGRPTLLISDFNTHFDTMLEVIDPERGVVLASERLSPVFWGFTSEGFLYSTLYEDGVVPVVEVWEAGMVER